MSDISIPDRVTTIPDYIMAYNGHVHINLRGEDLARFRQLFADLAEHGRLRDGSRVVRAIDVLKWLLDSVDQARASQAASNAKSAKSAKELDLRARAG